MPYSPLLRFHHLPLKGMPRGIAVEIRMRLEHERRSTVTLETSRNASIADEVAREIRVVESAAGESSSRYVVTAGSTTDSVVADKDTTEGFHTTQAMGSRETNPPAC